MEHPAHSSSHAHASDPRSFGLTVGGALALLAAWWWWRGRPLVPWVAVAASIAAVLILLAWLRPALLRGVSAAWWNVARVIGWVNTRALLSIVFFAIVTPIGLIRRLTGHDPLRRRRSPALSGWSPYPARLQDPKHYEHMY